MPAKTKTWESVPPPAEPSDVVELDTNKMASQTNTFQKPDNDNPRFAEQ